MGRIFDDTDVRWTFNSQFELWMSSKLIALNWVFHDYQQIKFKQKLLGWDDSHGVTYKVLKPFPQICQIWSEPNAEEVIITKSFFYIQLFKTNTLKNGVQMPIRGTLKKLELIKEKL
jgi:hypothetical protein